MIRSGENFVDGVRVLVERRKVRRIGIRVLPGGCVRLSVPKRLATLADGERFLREKWRWVLKARAEMAERSAGPCAAPPTEEERRRVAALLERATAEWAARLGEEPVACRMRRMKSLWGSCHWRRRVITYNTDLARVPGELAEYVVVHELTHLKAHNHGPEFQSLMDERLPAWRELRRRLNKSDFAAPPAQRACRVEQMTLAL